MDITCSLPTELLRAVFDHAGLSDLVRASHVRARWRIIVFAHKSYWSRIVLHETHVKALCAAQVEFAIGRLSRSSVSPVDLDVFLCRSYAPIDDLIACIGSNLHRFRELRIRLPRQYHQQLRILVSSPASLLECLELASPYVPWDLPRPLPSNFDAFVPHLRILRLRRFTIDNLDHGQFSAVQEVSLRGSTSLTAEVVAARYPNARIFTHRGIMLDFPASETLSPSLIAWMGGLQYLSLHKISLYRIVAWDVVVRIPTIRVYSPTAVMVDSLLSHFGAGDILLDLGRCIFPWQPMTIAQPSTGRKRILDFVDSVWLPDVARFLGLAPQIVEVSLPVGSWDEVFLAIGDPPQLRHIIMQLDEPLASVVRRLGSRMPPVYAPGLHALTLVGDARIKRVDGDGLVSFLEQHLVLRRRSSPVVLELRDVQWDDVPRELETVSVF